MISSSCLEIVMLPSIDTRGGMPLTMAAFSAGKPNAARLLPGIAPLWLDRLRIVNGGDSPGHISEGVVEPTRFELVTYCMPCNRAPSCATAPHARVEGQV